MERAQKAYRNYKNANAAFLRASANFKLRWPAVLYSPYGSVGKAYHAAHQRMINAYQRRWKAHNSLINQAAKFGIRYGTANQIRNMLEHIKYAPPSSRGGFGGIGYELTSLRWRKKPARATSVSPKRRVNPKRPHSV
jgi:hypothetical protein